MIEPSKPLSRARAVRSTSTGPRGRGPVRRFLETRGVIGRYSAPHLHTRLRTDDGVELAATYLPGPTVGGPAVALLHGFAANRRKPSYAVLADDLSQHVAVLTLDLRGHGRSGGASTLGDREALDAAAAVAWLRASGHRWVALVGLSMGATAAIHAAATGTEVDAVVAISATAWFRPEPDTAPMRRLASIWHTPWKRHGMRALVGVRVVAPSVWRSPGDPQELIRHVAAPVLVVHGDDDAYFPVEDAAALVANAAGHAVLWREPAGFGHAEDGVHPEFDDRLARALTTVAASGRFPVQEDGRP